MADRTERTTEPRSIIAGERVIWTRTFEDYPATEYSLEYRFRGPSTGFNVTATADGDAFDAAITAAQSATLTAGETYQWQAWLTEIGVSTNTWVIDSGSIKVDRGFATGTTASVDLRSDARITLDAIEATIQQKATADQLEYEITTPAGSRRLKRLSMTELLAARKEYAAIVARENAAKRAKETGKFGRKVLGTLWEK